MTEIVKTEQRPYDVSVIVPFLNEEENLKILYDDIVKSLETTKKEYEIVFVDDGSTDKSISLIESLAKKDNRVKLVEFTRNYGQTAAMAAGFNYATGKVYVAIDADNQNDPADIPALLEKINDGYDVVSGWRKNRQDKLISRKIPSKIANRILSWVTGVHLQDYGCSLKAYRAEYIDAISLYGEMHRFIPAYAAMAGAKVMQVPVNHRARTKGVSKYGLGRIYKVLMDLITVKFLASYVHKPSYVFGGMGAISCLLGISSFIEVIVEKFAFGTYAHKNPFLILSAFLFFLGLQFIMMGLLAELLVRTYYESQNKTTYLVKRTINMAL